MGGIAFRKKVIAYSAREGFDIFVKNATYEHGHDSYNGTINTCHLGNVKKLSDKYSHALTKKAENIIEDEENGTKGVATCLDLGVIEYHVISVSKKNFTPTAKYKMMHVVESLWEEKSKTYKSFNTKKEADDYAIKLTLEGMNVCVKKEYVLLSGEDIETTFNRKIKILKSKPKKIAKDSILKEVHVYIFYGWASS